MSRYNARYEAYMRALTELDLDAMAAMTAAPDRLSDLPDDLLIHVLSFAPSCEAASTTALSRRWRRPLWLETGVLNFDHRSYTTTAGGVPTLQHVWDDIRRAHRLCDIRKLTLLMRDDTTYLTDGEETVVPGVEELRVELLDCTSPAQCKSTFCSSLPFAALRVLEITGYILKPCSDARRRAFPCLEAMRLRRCRTEIATLQDMIDAAPRLADLRLEGVYFEDDQYEYKLRCPTVTVIVIANIHGFSSNLNFRACSIKLDAWYIHRIRYDQVTTFEGTCFSMKGQRLSYLEQVHLAVHPGSTHAAQLRRSFLSSVCYVRFLKLTAYSMSDLENVMQCSFYNLEQLEIEDLCGWCIGNYGAAARAFVNLLRRCSGLRELRLKFSWREYLAETTDPAVLSAAMSDFVPCRSLDNAGDNDKDDCCDGLDLHKLCCGCKLDCLQDSLRRVVVEFDAEEITCFQVRLVKFLAKNAMALEEFVVDGGKWYDSSGIDRKIARWRKRKRPVSSKLPAKTLFPRWPPLLSEFPLLDYGPGPDPNPATPYSEELIRRHDPTRHSASLDVPSERG